MAEPSAQPPSRPPAAVASILDEITDAFATVARDWTIQFVNRRLCEVFGRPAEEIVGRTMWQVFPEIVGGPFQAFYEGVMRERRPATLEAYVEAFGRWYEVRAFPSADGLSLLLLDVSDRKAVEQELARREQRYRVLAHAFSSVVWESDPLGAPLPSNTWSRLTGRQEDTRDLNWLDAVHPADRARVERTWEAAVATTEHFDATFRLRSAAGDWRHVRARGVPVLEDRAVLQWIGVLDDITEQVKAEGALRRAALEDPLTGLPNRAMFLDRVRAALDRRSHGEIAVMYVDMDGFKSINDTLGHAAGDRLLRTVADRLRAGVRAGDVATRLSGDEFAVMCDALKSREDALAIAGRLAACLAVPLGQTGETASASIGVAFAGPDERDAEALLRDADAAMYEAKARGGAALEVFDRGLRERLRRRKSVEAELRAGLDGGDGLDLHYQPIITFDATWPPTLEALLRWRASDGTTLAAHEVVSVAEQTGLIRPIGAEVLARACRRAAAWNAARDTPVAVSVNVSTHQLSRPAELLRLVRTELDASGLDPSLLHLEITESVLMEDRERGVKLIADLQDLGVKVAIDDFGVGYSSLSYLHQLRVDAVKIDRSFVSGLPHHAGSVRVVEAVVGIARAFDTRVIGEGVETGEQLATCRATGCDSVQGYLLARPVPEGGVAAALDAALAHVSPA